MGVTSTFLGICTIFDEDGRRFAANFFTNLPRHAGRASQMNTDTCDQHIAISMMAHSINPHRTVAGALFRVAQRDHPALLVERDQELRAITEAPHTMPSLRFGIPGLSA